jgi:hypothetical protein
MSVMTVTKIAKLLGVKDIRVERLARESLLIAVDKDADSNPWFDANDLAKYRVLAERIGGL